MQNKQATYKRSDNGGKLHFVRTDRERFELEDLLRASADVLGSGSFGSSYKAMLAGLSPVVVKSDFDTNGSLASHLHVKRRPDEPGLDWATRLKIIKGVARGLGYLYEELPRLSLPHGHLKSSNVLLDDDFNPLLSDYALVPVINKEHAQHHMVAFKSPEFTQHKHTTKKTDIWWLGILILEMLTGKYPANYLEQGTKNGEGEMLKLLKVGMRCCEWDVARRCDIREAVEKIEELKEREDEEEFSSYASEGDAYYSRAMEDDNFFFSVTN
ncbi:hypothetical protein L1987_55955 [Smallanthus sonchifolius]|uniref:Uncharacterized protein n=1 Tax=Smallanthus sonchifolius TaxID=185202 RepID=A0ACB9EBP1_9ASTR|nr:hypothetical protein L1987_55955 [Smallanthus sonchifolius]